MPKTVEEIKDEVKALVKSQGNQGAISLGTVLDDIAELAGEGGGGGSDALPKIVIKNPSGTDLAVETTADTKAIYDAVIVNKVANFAIDVDTEVIADFADFYPLLPTTARAILGTENNIVAVVAVFYPLLATQIIAFNLVFNFASDGAVTVTAEQYAYTISQ